MKRRDTELVIQGKQEREMPIEKYKAKKLSRAEQKEVKEILALHQQGLDWLEASRQQKMEAWRVFMKLGSRLNKKKEQLGHGNWLPWLKHLQGAIEERSAQAYMQLDNNEEWIEANPQLVADLGFRQLLELLASRKAKPISHEASPEENPESPPAPIVGDEAEPVEQGDTPAGGSPASWVNSVHESHAWVQEDGSPWMCAQCGCQPEAQEALHVCPTEDMGPFSEDPSLGKGSEVAPVVGSPGPPQPDSHEPSSTSPESPPSQDESSTTVPPPTEEDPDAWRGEAGAGKTRKTTLKGTAKKTPKGQEKEGEETPGEPKANLHQPTIDRLLLLRQNVPALLKRLSISKYSIKEIKSGQIIDVDVNVLIDEFDDLTMRLWKGLLTSHDVRLSPPTEEECLAIGLSHGLTEDEARYWWAARSARGWTRRTGKRSHAPVVSLGGDCVAFTMKTRDGANQNGTPQHQFGAATDEDRERIQQAALGSLAELS